VAALAVTIQSCVKRRGATDAFGSSHASPRSVITSMRQTLLKKSIILLACLPLWYAAEQPLRADIRVASSTQLLSGTGRLSWWQNTIAYDKPNSSGVYDIWTIQADGSGNTCLTCSSAAVDVLGALNKGNPVWNPSGKFIAFQVEIGSTGVTQAVIDADFPGSGWSNNLWIMDPAGQNFWQITNLPDTGGVIYPRFSADGTKIAWGQRTDPTSAAGGIWGTWQLMVGDFVVSSSGVPSVQNAQVFTPTYTPGLQEYYYEPHGFSADNQTLYFMSNIGPGGKPFFGGPGPMDIYALNLATNQLTALTNTPDQWNEFPTLVPGQTGLVYMSTVGDGAVNGHFKGDLWVTNADGTDKYQLTFFNDPNSPDYEPGGIVAADPAWNADGTQLAIYGNLGQAQALPGTMLILNIEPANAAVNAASYQRPPLAADTIVSIFGTTLANQTLAAPSAALPTSLSDTTVNVTDAKGVARPASLYFVSADQINCVIPDGTSAGPAVITVTNPDGVQTKSTVEIASVSPGLYTMNQNGSGVVAAYVQVVPASGPQTFEPVFSCPGGGAPCTTIPIDVSDTSNQYYLVMFGTGFRGRSSLQQVSVTIGKESVPVQYAGAQGQYEGFDQVNVQLPHSLAGAGTVNIVASADGTKANVVQMQLQ
jgi:uncharacterized protein (TIGR03437 family)